MRRPFVAAAFLALALTCGCSALIYMTGNQAKPITDDACAGRTPIYRDAGYIIARASLHVHSTYSDGQRDMDDLPALARCEGMAILGLNDHAVGKICWRDGVCLSFNGIERHGYKPYLDNIGRIKAKNPDLIILPGVEAMPYIYNAGKAPNFLVIGENTHFTVYGITDPAVFDEMPYKDTLRDLSPETFPGLAPYQRFVDYINHHGGMINAVHVDSEMDDFYGPAHFFMEGPVHGIHDLRGLNAFSILPEGFSPLAGGAGGAWDAALAEYTLGDRPRVPWALGDSDYHEVSDTMGWATTLFYLREFSETDVYAAMREGRMVALMGSVFNDSYVAEFSVADGGKAPARPVMLAEKVSVSSAPVVRFHLNRPVPGVTARLVRNGRVIFTTAGCGFEYTDREMFERGLPAYYRVELTGPVRAGVHGESPHQETASELRTNPVFVYPAK